MTLINDFLSLIYPRHCEACKHALLQHENYLCNYCLIDLPRGNYHNQNDSELNLVFAGRLMLNHVISLYRYEKSGRVQKLLHAIKYEGQKEMATFLGNLLGKNLKAEGFVSNFDTIIPVPLHIKKIKSRGYNQSEYFAKGLSESLQVPLKNDLIERVIETSTQTKKKKYERWENVEGIFKLTQKGVLKNKDVLLVDDVITTGATIEAAWLALNEEEEIKISVASIAFAAKIFG